MWQKEAVQLQKERYQVQERRKWEDRGWAAVPQAAAIPAKATITTNKPNALIILRDYMSVPPFIYICFDRNNFVEYIELFFPLLSPFQSYRGSINSLVATLSLFQFLFIRLSP